MVEYIPPPEPRTLLPPLLACLPLAFASPQPPPALLPLLSPILRQRVQLLSSTSSQADTWLRLLCWDPSKAERIQGIVESATFEPHPVSGEIEIEDDVAATYKRLDQETLRSQIPLPEYNLAVLFVWCPSDPQGDRPGWKVTELLPREGPADEEADWSASISEANERAQQRLVEDALRDAEQSHATQPGKEAEEEEEDDDAYWAQYDSTPGRTPALKRSPAPPTHLGSGAEAGSSDTYFSQYSEVQPALDNDDPSEDTTELGASSLNGDILSNLLQRQPRSLHTDEPPPRTNGCHLNDESDRDSAMKLSHPHPRSSSASSRGSDTVAKLEQSAESQSTSEVGIRQHISTNIKSLFRLAKSAGIPRAEFDSMVRRELEVLKITDDE